MADIVASDCSTRQDISPTDDNKNILEIKNDVLEISTSDAARMTSSSDNETYISEKLLLHKENTNLARFDLSMTDIISYNQLQKLQSNINDRINVKIVIVGDKNVGKTSLLLTYLNNGKYPQDKEVPNILQDYRTIIDGPNNKKYELSLWDVSANEEDERLRPFSYSDAQICFACYAIDDPASLVNLENTWVPEVRHFNPRTKIFLVGLKSDLYNDDNFDTEDDLIDYAYANSVSKNLHLNGHFQISSLAKYKIDELFDKSMTTVLHETLAENQNATQILKDAFNIKLPKPDKNRKELKKSKKKKFKCTIL
ncbi:hypothetical protein Kpol_1060p60 [Vanderwaltozyma polyspora DSM 70294]|uniref:Uncharacterized protein n=1 Tax=Vanderwaltozyma polyspora (strain ATCC 22028 / DSM 70294 / BCRC 21397 / CBS 2163 / NBRC 10782 / NRRL Y-8283 / UCD 57-17) TaxID=436907 RepID=A7TK57_VANPO|nr:uncharacterized protein Kpol_1060p60 [Vanderwaltozyma polyspora DSM 70294]EDO17403.1 hypothetical protein Kpol_1060p60 [Vanderwaltozyma polyspora DSM 70294]